MRTVAITLPETLLARVDEAAEAEADSRSAWIRDALSAALRRRSEEPESMA
jgi:metal-responsive CopG/Arc/MetJ family transcriptional regulator